VQRWPIVGRRSELEVFEQALASDERAGLVIYGRAGVGKTRLADECAAQAAAIGFPTERVVGSRTTSLLPLDAVAGLLAGGLGRLSVIVHAIPKLDELLFHTRALGPGTWPMACGRSTTGTSARR
jgi:AAA+ ATPase superfamily predicted ATPase